MQLNAILEILIGLVMTWLVVSATTSQIQEFIADLSGVRSRFLRKRIEEMFNDEDSKEVVEKLYKHSLIRSLGTMGAFGIKRPTANIPKQLFAQVIVDLYPHFIPKEEKTEKPAATPPEEKRMKDLKEVIGIRKNAVTVSPSPNLQTNPPAVLKSLMSKKETDGQKYLKNVEEWFDAKMDDASSVYRKSVTITSFLVGLILAVAFNVDSIHIAKQLWKDPTLRQAIVAQADSAVNIDEANFQKTLIKIDELAIPIGYDSASKSESSLTLSSLGWLITALAASQGAPFWFDILRNLTGLRKSEPAQKPKTD